MKLTRRRLAAVLANSAAAAAQNPQPVPGSPDEEMAAVKQANRRNQEALHDFKIPMATEPAFHFKA